MMLQVASVMSGESGGLVSRMDSDSLLVDLDYTTTRERQEQSDASLAKKWESEGDLLQAALTTDPNTNKKRWRWRGAHKKPTKPQATLNGLPLPVPPDGLATQVEDVPENELEMVLSKLSFQTGQPYIEGQGYHGGKTAPSTHTGGGKVGKVGEDLAAKVLKKPRRKQAKRKTFSSLLGSLLDCLPCHALTARLGLDHDDVDDGAREAPFKPAAYSAASLLRLLSQAEQHADDLVQGAVAKKQAMQKRLKEEVDQEVAAYRGALEKEYQQALQAAQQDRNGSQSESEDASTQPPSTGSVSRASTNEEAAADHVDTKCITDAVAMAIHHVTNVPCEVDATTRQYLRLPKGMITTGGPLKHKDTHIQTDPPHTRRGWL